MRYAREHIVEAFQCPLSIDQSEDPDWVRSAIERGTISIKSTPSLHLEINDVINRLKSWVQTSAKPKRVNYRGSVKC